MKGLSQLGERLRHKLSSQMWGLNQRPTVYETVALPTELIRRCSKYQLAMIRTASSLLRSGLPECTEVDCVAIGAGKQLPGGFSSTTPGQFFGTGLYKDDLTQTVERVDDKMRQLDLGKEKHGLAGPALESQLGVITG